MTLYIVVLFTILILYSIVISLLAYGWVKTRLFISNRTENPAEKVLISVIIAYRNEEQNLYKLINNLKQQDYDPALFEVLLINDHSDDNGCAIVYENISGITNFHAINTPEQASGKKAAIELGINSAKGELIAMTDADCEVPPGWLSTLNSFFHTNNKPDLITGLVDMVPANGFLQNCFRLDFLSLVVTSAGASKINRSIFNNAANLAIKKSSWRPENSNRKVASGDDVFQLHNIKKNNKYISLLKSNRHLITTPPPGNIKEFINQRIRWVSKASDYTDIDTLITAWLVLSVNLALLSTYVTLPVLKRFDIVLFSYGTKLLVDMVVFLSCKRFFNLKLADYLLIPIIELFYPVYVVTTVVLSKTKPFQWKGRKLKI